MEEYSVIVIATHAVFLSGKDIYGPPHAVSNYLNIQKIEHIFIKHSLDGNGYTLIEWYKNGKRYKKFEYKINPSKFPFFHYGNEIMFTFRWVNKHAQKLDIFIGVDPLNAITGLLLKMIGKTRKVIYFSADFALKRFENRLLNMIYLFLDKQAMYWTSQTWSISRRITSYRRKNGLTSGRNILLPNAPFFEEIKRQPIEKINRYHLVVVARLSEGIAFNLLIDTVAALKQEFPKVMLHMIGGGPLESELKLYAQKLGVDRHINFTGPKSHEEMFTILVKSGIGIALYNFSDPKHYHYFSDSMKVRDYLASGLPIIISGNSAIIDEIEKYKVGFVVTLDKKELTSKISSLFRNEKQYKLMRSNAIQLAKKYDTYSLLDRYFKTLT